jgi:hypothetical protein
MQTQETKTRPKSTPMLLVERLHPGKSIDVIVREACERHERLESAASELGVSLGTMRKWRKMFRANGASA